MLPLRLKLKLKPMLVFTMEDMDTVLDTLDLDMLDTDMAILPMDTPPLDTMERGLLMLSPRLRPMLDSTMEDMDTVLDMLVLAMPDLDMLDMDMAILDTDTPPLDTMARGLLMLSPRLRLMLDSTMVDMAILDTDTPPLDT